MATTFQNQRKKTGVCRAFHFVPQGWLLCVVSSLVLRLGVNSAASYTKNSKLVDRNINRMAASSNTDGAYVLRYGPKDSFLFGWILLILSALACILVILSQDQVVRRVSLVVAVLCGAGAASLLRSVSRLKQQSAWYLSFEPTRMQVNFFDYSNAGSGSPPEAAILNIPRDQLILIRKAKKIDYDNGDKFYVDMQVPHAVWIEAKRIRSEFQPHINPLTSHDREGFVQTFDGDILRIRLDQSRWPKGLDTYWRSCQYDIADEHDIRQTSNIEMIRTVPINSP